MKIHFINVGLRCGTWTVEVKKATPKHILAALYERRTLMSQDIEIDIDNGTIFAGGFRIVGQFTIEDPKAILN